LEPNFLSLDEVIAIHRDQIERYGGSEGLRDMGLLESAIAMPAAGFGGVYAHTDLFEMAAAYVFHLAANHPFVDGNKRVAGAAADVFLQLNGLLLTASEEEFEHLAMNVATGVADKPEIAAFYRKHCVPLADD
jgi:death on curing protein